MKALIVYASRKGQARKIAARLGNVLEAAGHAVTVADVLDLPSRFDLEAFDLVVVGSSVKFSRHSGAIAEFILCHRGALERRATAFFSVSGAAIPGSPEGEEKAREQVEDFCRETRWRPDRVAHFAGAVPYTRHDPITRHVLKRMQRKAGRSTDTSRDHEYTDWGAVESFGRELAGSGPPHPKSTARPARPPAPATP
jgi:menaquinone-dependent protoporphyrinogen oxidase